MLRIRRVVGASMEPTLYAGDIVIARKKSPALGDIVIAKVDGREVIKRIGRRTDTHVTLQGDNVGASTDSRSYGAVPITSVLGVVIKTLHH